MNRQISNTLKLNEGFSNTYEMCRKKEFEKLREFISTTPREFYDWYSNEHDNFVSFFFKNKERKTITFNGITKKELIGLYKECGEYLGQNLYDMEKLNGYFR